MKKGVFIIIFFLMLPVVFAEIGLRQDMNNYNLGDKISVYASVIEDVDVDGSFEAILECTSYVKKYFVTPIRLEKDFRTSINVPELSVTKNMVGSCKIKAVLEGDNGTIDTKYTDEFKVKSELNINCEAVEAMPGKEVEISCTARKLSLELVQSGTAKLNYRKKDYTTNIEDGMFSFVVFIQKDTPSGTQKTAVEVEDSKGNYGDLIFEVNVKAIPSKLELRVNKESFKPYETIEVRPVLYDHIGDFINTTISLDFTDPKDKKLISRDIISGETVSYTFDNFDLPGDYKIRSYSNELAKEINIKLESLSKLEMFYSNEKVVVKNVGNIIYNEKTTIVLENDEGKKYLVEKQLKLEPGETKEIDLSKEVPYNYYNIVLPEDSVDKNETEEGVIENVEIHDNRPIYKKAGGFAKSGIGMVTGSVINTVGFMAARPLFASIILIVITLAIVLFYSKGFIKSKISRVKIKADKKEGIRIEEKKEGDDLEGLFKDFKYGKE